MRREIFLFSPANTTPLAPRLEAMASGLPVIVSNTSGVSEIITHGKDGFIINHPIDAKEIANNIHVLLEKETREQMGIDARQKSEMYSFEANVEKNSSYL